MKNVLLFMKLDGYNVLYPYIYYNLLYPYDIIYNV